MYIKFHFSRYNLWKEKYECNLHITGIFLKSKGHNSVKTDLIIPKIVLDLDILMINLYNKSHFNRCNLCEENERNMRMDSSKPIRSPFFEGWHKKFNQHLIYIYSYILHKKNSF